MSAMHIEPVDFIAQPGAKDAAIVSKRCSPGPWPQELPQPLRGELPEPRLMEDYGKWLSGPRGLRDLRHALAKAIRAAPRRTSADGVAVVRVPVRWRRWGVCVLQGEEVGCKDLARDARAPIQTAEELGLQVVDAQAVLHEDACRLPENRHEVDVPGVDVLEHLRSQQQCRQHYRLPVLVGDADVGVQDESLDVDRAHDGQILREVPRPEAVPQELEDGLGQVFLFPPAEEAAPPAAVAPAAPWLQEVDLTVEVCGRHLPCLLTRGGQDAVLAPGQRLLAFHYEPIHEPGHPRYQLVGIGVLQQRWVDHGRLPQKLRGIPHPPGLLADELGVLRILAALKPMGTLMPDDERETRLKGVGSLPASKEA
eukprot:CAMPEP_0175368772 /NCGR_PEP_ID=MMETSP0095-20121207/20352_1 /TAXON_ID=311494 /ORGANISM="Alexandrium monilatum, Strain CCMP3105" /LENGTH=366 /DNA_ID=CAMNT_0016666875 /DNA_START=304 /DNA_END=1403 /DNA_ORIENTATION=-